MGDTIRCISPVDGSLYAEMPIATQADIEKTFAAASAAQQEWRKTPISERAKICNRMVDAMLAMRDEIVPELAWQMGRPVRFGGGELNGLEERARYMISIAEEALAPIDPGPREGFARSITREPLGTVFVIAPWNYPFLTAVNAIVPALMAGNAVVLKHASSTPLVARRFQQAFDAAGLPAGLFSHLFLSHGQTAGIISSGLADMVNFTGSVGGGRAMEEAAVGRFIPVGLELGGKDPGYVRADADVAFAAEGLVDGAFFNSGQSCCGIERIYVHADVHDEFVDRFVEITKGYVLGNPLDEATTLGPMIKASAADFVRGQIDEALRAGARAHIDAKDFPLDAPGSPYMAPQVLTDVNHQMSIMREESFGPVIGIMKVRGDEEAVQLMNDSEFGLTASVWTKDAEAADRLAEELEAGTIYMNRCDYLDPALAWTGWKNSGRGVTLSKLGYEVLTRPKSRHFRLKTD